MNQPIVDANNKLDPLIGQTLAGQFEILQRIGGGGMGTVYKARNISLDAIVALKLVHRALLGDSSTEKRLQKEAKALAHLTHPNILRVFSMQADGASCFIAMEYIEGTDLDQVISKDGPLPPERFQNIFTQTAAALDYAHSSGVIHRDLKPSNIMLVRTADGAETVKLVDFGIAKILAFNDQKVTKTGMILGTPAYISPEILTGTEIDARSDIYSLGCVMYHAATGSPPFAGESPIELAYKHLHEPAPEAATPAYTKFKGVIAKSLNKLAADRYQTAMKLGSALLKGENEPQPVSAKTKKSHKHRAQSRIPIAALVACAAILAAVFYFCSTQQARVPPAPTTAIEDMWKQTKAYQRLTEEQIDYLESALSRIDGPHRDEKELQVAAIFAITHQELEEKRHLRAAIVHMLERQENAASTIINLGDRMCEEGNCKQVKNLLFVADSVYDKLDRKADQIQVLLQLARLYQKSGEIGFARSTLKKATTLTAVGTPVYDDAVTHLALFEYGQRNYASCDELLTQWLESEAMHASSVQLTRGFGTRGLSLVAQGKRKEAQPDLREALEWAAVEGLTPTEENIVDKCRANFDGPLPDSARAEDAVFKKHRRMAEEKFLPPERRVDSPN